MIAPVQIRAINLIAWSIPTAALGWLALAYLGCFRWYLRVGRWPTPEDSRDWFRDTYHDSILEAGLYSSIWTVPIWTLAMFLVIAIDLPRIRRIAPFAAFWAVPAWFAWVDQGNIVGWLDLL